jgi:hypothetical protein
VLDRLARSRVRILISKPYHTRSAEPLWRRYRRASPCSARVRRRCGAPSRATPGSAPSGERRRAFGDRLFDPTGLRPPTWFQEVPVGSEMEP